MLDALRLAALTTDSVGRVALVNAAARDFLGASADDLTDRPVVAGLFPAPERGPAGEVLSKALAGESWQGELSLLGRDGIPRPTSVSVAPLREGERITGVLLVVDEVGSSRKRAQRLTDRLTRLASVTAELLLADDLADVTAIVIGHMADAAGATVASLSLLVDDDRLQLLGIRGGREGAMGRWATYALDGTPAGDCVSTRRTLVLSGREAIHARYPELERAAEGERSMVCLPLIVGGRAIGAATMSFPGHRTFDGAELEFFRVMSDTCAHAVDRVQALAEAADQAVKLKFLADASEELSSSLDYESTLANVATLAVPRFADWCSIALGVDGELRTLAVAHVDPDKVALAREFQERFPPDPDAPRGSYQVFRTGRSELTPEITDEMLDASGLETEQLRMVRALNVRSAMSVPLAVNDRVLGVVTWVAGERGRRFDARDLSFGEDLARRAAVAIDNAQLHTEMREMAVRLQRAVLPAELPSVEGWQLAAFYSPAGHLDAGGDFYDVIPLGGSRIAAFIGDVMGRGFGAAAAMAQARAAIRALVAVDPEPTAVLTRLDTVFQRYELDQLVTLLYVVVDPFRDEITVANAGHLPPVLIDADGHPRTLQVPEEVLLGAGGGARTSITLPFAAGETLLAFTDGLIERRNEDIDAGQRRLLEASADLPTEMSPGALERLVLDVADPGRDDDVAVLTLRRSDAGAGRSDGGSGPRHAVLGPWA